MSGLDPSGPAQPDLKDAYTTASNPASQTQSERVRASQNRDRDGEFPSAAVRGSGEKKANTGDATFSSLGTGVRGAGPGEEKYGRTNEDVGRHHELDAEQMGAPGEGRVSEAVEEKPGASGEQVDLAADLDRKKAEQAPLRDAIKEQRKDEVDVGGILGQRGGPANPVDKDGYPNAGS